MANKGSKYARKQAEKNKNLEDEITVSPFTFLEDGEFLDVIYDDVSYFDIFNHLSLTDQIKAYRILKRLAASRYDTTLSETDRQLAENSWYKLETINKAVGLKIEEKQHYPLSADELHIIRMNCYGAIDARPRHQLSRFYKELISKPMSQSQPYKNYNLDQAPCWQLFRQFSDFRKLEPAIRSYLHHQQINPEILPLMGVRDFSDLIFRTFRKDEKQTKVFFSEYGTPRNNYVKAMARKFSKKIAEILRKEGYDERYICSLLNAMRMFGKSDAEKLIITETHFTPRVLHDLQKAGIATEEYKIGEEIPQELVERLISLDQGKLLTARDETGAELKGKDFPSFEVHHINAVVESGRLANLAAANYRHNFLLVNSAIHRHILHGFDKLVVFGKKEAYSQRMELTNPCVTFMFGLRPDQQIEYDWTKQKSFKKQAEEDSRFIVSYEEIMNSLAENRQRYLDNSKTVEFDIDNVVQVIRHKKAIEAMKIKKKKTEMTNGLAKWLKEKKSKSK